jgi:diguanylate cyclase (GGDEF)-like protein
MIRYFCALLAFAVAVLLAPTATAVPLEYQASNSCAVAGPRENWTWLEVADPPSTLNSGWVMLVDQTRFQQIDLVIHNNLGPPVEYARSSRQLASLTSLGNKLTFEVPIPAASVTRICLGYEGLDDLSLMRTIKALSPAEYSSHLQAWMGLTMAVCGVLLCALVYNLFLMAWLQSRFQRWYVIWLASGIGYSVSWSGAIYYALPDLDGSWRIRANLVLAGLLIGSATAFFFDFIERKTLPAWLIRAGRVCALWIVLTGALAALDQYLPAHSTDLVLNIGFVTSIVLVAIGITFGIQRGSRAVWFYVAAWTAPMIVFALRVARNFCFLGQSDIVDMASLAAIAFEAIILSLAVADRFRGFLRQRDAAEAEREALRRVASTDALTGLGNRAAFQARFQSLQRHRSADLLIIDLDDLKETNDTAGHDAGDALIVESGRRLKQLTRDRGFVARLGGDEFALMLVDDERTLLPSMLEEIERLGRQPLSHGGHTLSLRFSGGLASWTRGSGSPERLYKEADLALYRAKADGGGCWRAYSTDVCDEMETRRSWVAQARGGLDRREFELHYQPIVDLRTGDIQYHEALLRWRHADDGLLRPGAFMQAFEDLGLSIAIQESVLQMALDALQASHSSDHGLEAVSVNFLACQLQGTSSAAHILQALASRGLKPCSLNVEVTENVVVGRPGSPVIECLRTLRNAGVGVSLDDFGTGYASLVHLRDLPADVLKIDRSFIAGMVQDAESKKIVRAIVSLAHNLGRRVVAEGIETLEQKQFLQRLGCDLGQGHLLGFPLPYVTPNSTAREQVA